MVLILPGKQYSYYVEVREELLDLIHTEDLIKNAFHQQLSEMI